MYRALIAGFAITAMSACATVEKTIVADPGAAFRLPVGETATVRESDTKLTFRTVREDSRCPANAVCVWEGDAKIELISSRNASAEESKILSLTPPNNEARFGDVMVRFVRLDPWPGTVGEDKARAYIAELVVTRL